MHAHGKSHIGTGSLLYQDWRSFAISYDVFSLAGFGKTISAQQNFDGL
jgi:hypothetical protein